MLIAGCIIKYSKVIIIHLLFTFLIFIRDVQKTMFKTICIYTYIYTYTDYEVHNYSMTSVMSSSSGIVDLNPKKSNTSSAVNISLIHVSHPSIKPLAAPLTDCGINNSY